MSDAMTLETFINAARTRLYCFEKDWRRRKKTADDFPMTFKLRDVVLTYAEWEDQFKTYCELSTITDDV